MRVVAGQDAGQHRGLSAYQALALSPSCPLPHSHRHTLSPPNTHRLGSKWSGICIHLVGRLPAEPCLLLCASVGVKVLEEAARGVGAWQAPHPQAERKAAVAGVWHAVQQHGALCFLFGGGWEARWRIQRPPLAS